MRSSKRHLLVPLLLGLGAVLGYTVASSAAGPTIEAGGGGYGGYYWSPASAEVGAGGTVAFKNPSVSVPHGVTWSSGPESPNCTGVPINQGKTNWSGSCTFTQAGTYAFYCTVHPIEMTGTITVSSSGTITTSPPPPSAESPPVAEEGSPVGSAVMAARVARVRGGKALLKLRCRSGGNCRGLVKLLAKRKLIGNSRFSIPAGRAKVVRVKLRGRGKALVRKAGKRGLKVELTGRGVKRRTVVLKR